MTFPIIESNVSVFNDSLNLPFIMNYQQLEANIWLFKLFLNAIYDSRPQKHDISVGFEENLFDKMTGSLPHNEIDKFWWQNYYLIGFIYLLLKAG